MYDRQLACRFAWVITHIKIQMRSNHDRLTACRTTSVTVSATSQQMNSALNKTGKALLCAACLFAFIPVQGQRAKQFVDQGLAAFDRGDTNSARDAFEKALSLKKDEVTAHTYLGIIADRAGDLKGAERHFAAAVKGEPNSASARNNYGAILMRTGRQSLAAVEFEKSLKLDP